MIFPKDLCYAANITAGAEYEATSFGDTITLVPKSSMIPETDDDRYVNTVFTIGYEGRDIDRFINRLKSHGIKQIIDVREIPLSRKKGFSKNALRERLADEGIRYIHMPELGSPSDIRHQYKNGGSERQFFYDYEKYVDDYRKSEIKLMDSYASAVPSALMCFELSYVHCHRKILAEKLSLLGYEVVHI